MLASDNEGVVWNVQNSLWLSLNMYAYNFSFEIFAAWCFYWDFFFAVVVIVVTMLFSVWLFSKNFFLRYFFFCLFEDLFVALLLLRSYLHNAHKGDTDGHEKKITRYTKYYIHFFSFLFESIFFSFTHNWRTERVCVWVCVCFVEIFALCVVWTMKFDIVKKIWFRNPIGRINAYREINSLAVTLVDRFYRECTFLFRHIRSKNWCYERAFCGYATKRTKRQQPIDFVFECMWESVFRHEFYFFHFNGSEMEIKIFR